MTETAQVKSGQPPLIDSILQEGKLAFDPELLEETRQANVVKFEELLKRF